MRILLITQYFSPEITAAPMRLHPFASGLAARGHEVEVISEVPSHPQGVVAPGYGGRAVDRRDFDDGFRVSYVWTHATPSKKPLHRIASYATYAAMALTLGSVRRRPDVVLASSPPLSVGLVGSLVARRFRAPWVLDVRDLWPEIAGALGQVGDSGLLRMATRLERALYRDASAVTTVTEPFCRHIEERRGRPGVHLIPNGTTRMWLDASRLEVSRADLGLPEDGFLLTYAGNVGLSQGIDAAIEAVRLAGPGFRLLIVGDGASRSRLENAARSLPPGQVIFRDPVPAPVAAQHLRASDALLVSLSDNAALAKTIPIKLFDYCAVGRPVIVSAPGEARRLAEQRGIALVSEPGDAASLAAALRTLSDSPETGRELAVRGQEFAAEHLRDDLIDDLERILADARRS